VLFPFAIYLGAARACIDWSEGVFDALKRLFSDVLGWF
jgi:hypothetical protein